MGSEAFIAGRHYRQKKPFLQKNFHWICFILLFFSAAYLRHFSFFLPSHKGDSTAYQSLAMKMNHGFMKHYDVFNYRMTRRGNTGLVDYIWDTNPQRWNARRIRKIYHLPLHLQPPLLPTLIWLSHGVFSRGKPYTSVWKNEGKGVVKKPPWPFFRTQFYAIFIPFFFSLLTLLAVYLFCLKFFSYREGLLAVLILATSPLDIAISSRLYADGVLTTLTTLGLFLYLWSLTRVPKKGMGLAFLAGICLGLAYLTRISGILFAFGFVIATLLHPNQKGHPFRKFLDARLLVAGAASFFIALPWHLLVFSTYGTIIPPAPPVLKNNPWQQMVFGRSPWAYLVALSWFVPATVIGWASGIYGLLSSRRYFVQVTFLLTSLFYLGVYIVFLKGGIAGVENRFMLPLYPLLSILAAWGIVSFLKLLKRNWMFQVGYAICFGILMAVGWHSVSIGFKALFGYSVVFRPFGY